MRRRISRAQQTKNWCVGFSFPPPAYAGIHPTLYLFGFRADALNSHSPPYLPGFDPRSCLERFDTFSGSSGKVVGFSCRGLRSSETVRGPPGPLGGFRGPLVPSFSRCTSGFWGAFEASGGLPRASPGASGVPPGASGGLGAPPGGLGGPRGFFLGPGNALPGGSQISAFSRPPPGDGWPVGPQSDAQKTPARTPPGRPRTPPRTPLGRFPGHSRTPPQGPGGPPGSPKTLETPQMRPQA